MTDPDLVFEMNPQNVRRVEQWIADRWPAAGLRKQADGSRLTWSLEGSEPVTSVAATESFLSLPPAEVDRHLEQAQAVCDESRAPGSSVLLLLATDGPRTVDGF